MKTAGKSDAVRVAAQVIEQEIAGLKTLQQVLDVSFARAVDLILSIEGRVILSGMGKSGHIARKIAATLASTGTPAFFVHPGEASHGDLGMITEKDAVILLSNSGETAELKDIIAYCKRFSIPLLALVRRSSSMLVQAADIAFVLPETPEASPVSAPTTSTTMMLVWGDALAVALLEARGFGKDDFHVLHPGGKLGTWFLKVDNIMKKDGELPVVRSQETMANAMIIMTNKALGCAIVCADSGEVEGIITDGDLRRHMSDNLMAKRVAEVMTKDPLSIRPHMLVEEALAIMNKKQITNLIVKDDRGVLRGVVHIHDILRAGVQ